MFQLEYAQFRNREFSGWIDAGRFPTRAAAAAEAKERGLRRIDDDHMISKVVAGL
jgi:hypothetical protein